VAAVDGVVEGVGSCRRRRGEVGKGGCEGGAVREVRPPEKSPEKMEAHRKNPLEKFFGGGAGN
ncbi:hypothetical protein Tco_0343929, partial [Tanacetum coccineum]